MDRRSFLKTTTLAAALALPGASLSSAAVSPREITDYNGSRLDGFDTSRDVSIKGPQTVDPDSYRLRVHGLVHTPLDLTYAQALTLPHHRRAVTLHSSEGWTESLLFEGFQLGELLLATGPHPRANTLVFTAVDGFSTALPLADVLDRGVIVASRINGRVLDAKRGFPFRLVAESKLGYKWVRWLTSIEVSTDENYLGYWESRGYPNRADLVDRDGLPDRHA